MKSILKKVLTYFILPLIIAGLTWAIVRSVMEPVNFNKHRAYRESVAIQRLKDIRDLQVAYKNVNGRYASTIDSLKLFYNEGKMKITMNVGSKDDSLAMAHTDQIKKKFRYLKGDKLNAKLNELYLAGDQNLVFQIVTEIPVKDTIFRSRTDFNVDELAIIPFSGDSVIMESTIKTVSGVKVPLFEASMPSNLFSRDLSLSNFESTLMLSARIRDATKAFRWEASLLLTTMQVTGSNQI